jgi:hypothetical protein
MFLSAQHDKVRSCIGRIFFGFAFVCAIGLPVTEVQAIGHGTTGSSPTGVKTGRLIVQRAPNFGRDLVVRLSIDGRKVADIPRNQHYGDYVSVGHHVLTVLALPNIRARGPASVRLTVKSGYVYIYTATWESDRLVLRPSNFYSPSKRVNEEIKK